LAQRLSAEEWMRERAGGNRKSGSFAVALKKGCVPENRMENGKENPDG
jgi:hypothetical protein